MKKKILSSLLILVLALSLTACENNSQNSETPSNPPAPLSVSNPATESEDNTKDASTVPDSSTTSDSSTAEPSGEDDAASEIKIKITVGEQEMTATLEDNATSRALIEKLPLTLPMLDLYSREMCYRFPDELPTDSLRSDGYEVGDLAYWPPRHSFVILYEQNGEEFSRQHIGHIDSGVEVFNGTGDADVTFELLDE
nr:cyclophilin-like fold protein [uncultured Clostridium sp.]